MTTILLFKLLAAPVLILCVTLLARRFGPAMGGLAMGIPLLTGPISVFTALEQGTGFASQAAIANLVGQVSTCVFCFSYARAARRFGAWASAAIGILCFLAATLVWSQVRWTLLEASGLLAACIAAMWWTFPKLSILSAARAPTWWELPLRMMVAALFVLALTALTNHLSAELSGLLAPFPVFVLILALFTHLHYGPGAAAALAKGVVVGSPAFAAFFVVVAAGLPRLSVGAVYAIAALVGVGVSGCIYLLMARARPADAGKAGR